MKSHSRVRLFETLWTVAHQARWPMGFCRHEYWGGLPFPSPGDLPNPGIEPRSPALLAYALPSELPIIHKSGFDLELRLPPYFILALLQERRHGSFHPSCLT